MDKRLTLGQMRVLIALLSFRSKGTETVWPSREQIASRCGMPACKISTATSELERLGWIKKEGSGGHSKSTRYTFFAPDTVTDLVTVTEQVTVTDLVTVKEQRTVTDSVTGGVTESVTGGVTDSVTRKEVTNEVTNEVTKNTRARSSPSIPESPPPEGLDLEAWKIWFKYRAELRKPIRPVAIPAAQKSLAEFGSDQMAVVERSIANSWQGLFDLPANHRSKTPAQATAYSSGQCACGQRGTIRRGGVWYCDAHSTQPARPHHAA